MLRSRLNSGGSRQASAMAPANSRRLFFSLYQLQRPRKIRFGRPAGGGANSFRCRALFNFGKSGQEKEKRYASDNGRDDYKEADVEDYFNYMGMLAAEGNYDRLEKMFQSGTPPVDLLLLMAASENDAPKVAEVLRAGANLDIKDLSGKNAKELTNSEAVLELLDDREKAFTF